MFELIDKRTGDIAFSGSPVSRRRPCKVCGKPDWCIYDAARNLTICPRTPGGKRIGDAGWLHSDGVIIPATTWVAKPQPQREVIDFAPYAAWCVENAGEHIDRLAKSLDLSVHALEQFAVGWDVSRIVYTFPMLNANHAVIGIRTRDTKTGAKFSATGSHNGLFIPMELAGGEHPLFIEEGPTSAAALVNIGLDAIGRPSCSACVDMTVDYVLNHHAHREVVIVGNYDEPKTRPSGQVFYPGQEGAAKLADALAQACVPVRVIFPLHGKDSRDWKSAGATRDTVLAVVAQKQNWRAA